MRGKGKRFVINKSSLLKPNNDKAALVLITDKNYYLLAKELVESIVMVEPDIEAYVFDIGLLPEQVDEFKAIGDNNVFVNPIDIDNLKPEINLPRRLKAYLTKIIAVKRAMELSKAEVIIYSDAASLFMGSLKPIKNFVKEFGFYAGMTQTYTSEWMQHHAHLANYADELKVDVFSPDTVGIEGGLWAIHRKHKWTHEFIDDFYEIAEKRSSLFSVWPGDQIVISILIYKFVNRGDAFLSEVPNIRFMAVHDKRKEIEKNMVMFDYELEKAPFFGYVSHNCMNSDNVPETRRANIDKKPIEYYIQK